MKFRPGQIAGTDRCCQLPEKLDRQTSQALVPKGRKAIARASETWPPVAKWAGEPTGERLSGEDAQPFRQAVGLGDFFLEQFLGEFRNFLRASRILAVGPGCKASNSFRLVGGCGRNMSA